MAETLREHPRPGSNSNGQLVASTLKSQAGRGWSHDAEATYIAGATHVQGGSQQDQFVEDDGVVPTLAHSSNTHHGNHQPKYVSDIGVRRLTPRECERLQSLPDDWTAHGADSRRYAALGDAVTSSVAEWIGRRLLSVLVGTREHTR